MGIYDFFNTMNMFNFMGFWRRPNLNLFSFFQPINFNFSMPFPSFSFNSTRYQNSVFCPQVRAYNNVSFCSVFQPIKTAYQFPSSAYFGSTYYPNTLSTQNSFGQSMSQITPRTPNQLYTSAKVSNPFIMKNNSVSSSNRTVAADKKALFTNSKIKVTEVNVGDMPYLIISPQDVNPNEKLPVLVHLHGSWHVGQNLKALQARDFDMSKIMNSWDKKNFRGYIICPLLKNKKSVWHCKSSAQKLRNLLTNFERTHNVDKTKVAVTGASLGAEGALYMANELSDVFRKAAAYSPYNPGNIGAGMKIPTKIYCGATEGGQPKSLVQSRLNGKLSGENCTELARTGHNGCTRAALSIDKNKDGCSDLLEWLFT